MKIIARRPVQVGGHIYSRGEALEWEGPVTQRIADNFAGADGKPLEAAGNDGAKDGGKTAAERKPDAKAEREKLIKKTVDTLKREGIRQRLDDMGITYSTSSKTEYLAKLMLMATGEIEEA